MQSIINKIKENIVDRIVEVFWIAIKAAVITAIILILLQIIPINIQHTGYMSVDQSGTWGLDVSGDVGVMQSDRWWTIRN